MIQNNLKHVSSYFTDMQIDYLNLLICNKIQDKLTKLPMEYYDDYEQYNNLTQVNDEALNRSVSIIENISLLVQYIVGLFGIIGILWSFNKMIMGISILSYIPVFFINVKIAESLYAIYKSRIEKLRLVESLKKLSISYENIKEIKIYKLGYYIKDKISDIYKNYIWEDKIIRKNNIKKRISVNVLQNFFSYAIKIYIVLYSVSKKLSIGQLTMYINATDNLQLNVGSILNIFSELHKDLLYIDKFFKLLEMESVKEQRKREIPDLSQSTIIFHNVSFRYPNSDRYILKDINFSIKYGLSYLLVGLNGSGKTTLVKLLCGLYKPTNGEILLNGINLFEYNLDSYRNKIGTVFQDFIKYPLSVRENIRVGDFEKDSEKEIITAAVNSGASDFIQYLKNKYNTILQNEWTEGTEISLGQWQKVAISRALYAQADFLIMDEPTASLDAQAENELYTKIKTIIKEKTCLVISHRFSTAKIVDKIMVLEQGKIVEEGSFDMLIKKKEDFPIYLNYNRRNTKKMKIHEFSYDNKIISKIVYMDNNEKECLMGTLVVNIGALYDDKFKGAAHLLEHQLLSFDRIPDDNKHRYYSVRGITNEYATIYRIKTRSGYEDIEELIKIIRNIISGNYLSINKFEMIKDDVIVEIDKLSEDVFNQYKYKSLYSIRNNLGYKAPLGSRNDILQMQYSDIVEFYRTNYMKANIAIYITGDVKNIQYTNELLQNYIASIRKDEWKGNNTLVDSVVGEGDFLFRKSNQEYEYYIMRKSVGSIKERCIEDILFIIFENKFSECWEIPIIDVACYREYGMGVSYIKICIKCAYEVNMEKSTMKNILCNIIDIGLSGYFEIVKENYIFYLETQLELDIEFVVDELVNNFIYNEAVFLPEKYLKELDNLTSEELKAWAVKMRL